MRKGEKIFAELLQSKKLMTKQPPKNNQQSAYDIKLLFPVLFLVG